eukprot:1444887-Pleurochrysis_carterae.AAC.4
MLSVTFADTWVFVLRRACAKTVGGRQGNVCVCASKMICVGGGWQTAVRALAVRGRSPMAALTAPAASLTMRP